MPDRIPQSISIRVPLKAYLSSDHVSNATGVTIACVISKNGAAFGNPSAGAANATEIGSGWYYLDLSSTDIATLGPLIVRGTASGVDDVEIVYQVVDANSLGAAYLDAAVSSRNATAPPTVVQIRSEMDANSVKLANLDVTVSSRSTYSGVDTPGTTTLLARVPGTIQPQTGDAYARLGVPANATVSADIASVKVDTGGMSVNYTPARAVKLDNLDAAVSSRSTYAGADTPGTTTLLSRLTPVRTANLDNLDAPVSNVPLNVWTAAARTLTSFGTVAVDTADNVWTAGARTLTAFNFNVVASNALSAQQTANAVWDEPASAHTISGSTGSALTNRTGGVTINGSPLSATLASKQKFSATLSPTPADKRRTP